MLGDIRQARNIYIVCGYTDMRKGLNSLVPFVQQNFGIDPYSSSLFLFCGKRCDRLKALLWEPDGFVLLYKRVEEGVYQWPRDRQEVTAPRDPVIKIVAQTGPCRHEPVLGV